MEPHSVNFGGRTRQVGVLNSTPTVLEPRRTNVGEIINEDDVNMRISGDMERIVRRQRCENRKAAARTPGCATRVPPRRPPAASAQSYTVARPYFRSVSVSVVVPPHGAVATEHSGSQNGDSCSRMPVEAASRDRGRSKRSGRLVKSGWLSQPALELSIFFQAENPYGPMSSQRMRTQDVRRPISGHARIGTKTEKTFGIGG